MPLPRELVGLDNFTQYLVNVIEADTSGDTVDNDLQLSTGENNLALQATGEQWRKVFDCVMSGADLLYPTEAHEIVWIVWRTAKRMGFCDTVADCIENSSAVQDALNQYFNQQFPGGQDGIPAIPSGNNLDCIYGATASSYELLIDWWLKVKVVIDAAGSLADTLSELLPAGNFLLTGMAAATEALLIAGSSAYDAWINSQAVEDAFRCAIFDGICGRGLPYTLTDGDINAGFAAIENETPPLALVTDVIKQVSTYGALKQLWVLRTDDTCSNDWETLCSCTPFDWQHTFNFASGQQGWIVTVDNLNRDRSVWTGSSFFRPMGATIQDNLIFNYPSLAGVEIVKMDVNYVNTPNGPSPTMSVSDFSAWPSPPPIDTVVLSSTAVTIALNHTFTNGLNITTFAGADSFLCNHEVDSVTLYGNGTEPTW